MALLQTRTKVVVTKLPAPPPRLRPRPLPTVVPLRSGPLQRLAWIFGFGR